MVATASPHSITVSSRSRPRSGLKALSALWAVFVVSAHKLAEGRSRLPEQETGL